MIYGITEKVVVSSPVDIETCTERLDLCCCHCTERARSIVSLNSSVCNGALRRDVEGPSRWFQCFHAT